MPSRHSLTAVLAAVLVACGTATGTGDPPIKTPSEASNALTIATSKATYGWEEVSFGGSGIVAAVANPNARDYFANVGDAFNGSADQPIVFIALGTDASVQWLESSGTWSDLPTGVLVEGSKVVALRAGRRYELRGNLSEPRRVGTMRIRLRYFTSANTSGAAPMVDYSAPFTVR